MIPPLLSLLTAIKCRPHQPSVDRHEDPNISWKSVKGKNFMLLFKLVSTSKYPIYYIIYLTLSV